MFELQVVQQAGDIDEFVVVAGAVEVGEDAAEKVGAIGMLQHVDRKNFARLLFGGTRERGIGQSQTRQVEPSRAAPTGGEASTVRDEGGQRPRDGDQELSALPARQRTACPDRPFPVDAGRRAHANPSLSAQVQ
ncbi:hypothetical protein [Nocardia brasiliensis]|uniref:hypothetical protein n=1 Tax=Nocardia brasiliensis TaxID=37326 RepID=UPI002454552E|nr:hypothetical protein [Nocardia brasiliensis]